MGSFDFKLFFGDNRSFDITNILLLIAARGGICAISGEIFAVSPTGRMYRIDKETGEFNAPLGSIPRLYFSWPEKTIYSSERFESAPIDRTAFCYATRFYYIFQCGVAINLIRFRDQSGRHVYKMSFTSFSATKFDSVKHGKWTEGGAIKFAIEFLNNDSVFVGRFDANGTLHQESSPEYKSLVIDIE